MSYAYVSDAIIQLIKRIIIILVGQEIEARYTANLSLSAYKKGRGGQPYAPAAQADTSGWS